MALVQSITTLVLNGQPSCIQFVPGLPEYALIGTYELENDEESGQGEPEVEKTQTRKGSLLLMQVTGTSMKIVQTVNTNYGILHLQVSPLTPTVFCTANSTGTISFYSLSTDSDVRIRETCLERSITDDRSTIVHYVQWHPLDPSLLAVTLSTGEGLLVSVDPSEILSGSGSSNAAQESSLQAGHLTAHFDQAWTLSFTADGQRVLTGGDDSVLQYAQLRPQHPSHESSQVSDHIIRDDIWAGVMSHGAGVISILPLDWPIILTGSYDDHIRVIQAADRKPKVLAELNLGGGVWRLNVLERSFDAFEAQGGPEVSMLVLASCMYAGTRVVNVCRKPEGWSMEVVARFEEHDSMNYGSDWQIDRPATCRKVVSTSFYDKLVCLWHVPPI